MKKLIALETCIYFGIEKEETKSVIQTVAVSLVMLLICLNYYIVYHLEKG